MIPRPIALTTLLSFVLTALPNPTGPLTQQLNPPYLSEMPSVERVLSAMKTADPKETALRQIGAFYQLIEIIKALSGRREFRGLTPDESRIVGAYDTAQFTVAQAADKAFPGPGGSQKFSDQTPYRYSRWDSKFGVEGIQTFKTFLSPALKAEFDKIVQGDNTRRQAREDSYKTPPAPAQTQSSTGTPKPGSQAELRRCAESGRPLRVCFSESMTNGMDQLSGLSNFKEPSPPGFRMTGDYSSRGGFRLILLPDKVSMICHGVGTQRTYSVQITETQALLKIPNEGKTVVFSLLPDGKLSGTGPIRITGQVPAGTRTEQTSGMTTQNTTRQRQLEPGEERYYPNATKNGQVWSVTEDTTELAYGPTGSRTVTNYVTKTVDCILGLMNPDGPTPFPPDIESPMGILTSIMSGTAVLMKGGTIEAATKNMLNQDHPIPPGLRMSGRYAGASGFSITFHPESATLACGDAEHAREYSIKRAGNQTMLQLQDKTNPLALQLKSDGSLFGQGTVQVNGRTIVGTTEDPDNPFVFAPKVGRCEVGTLAAGGAISNTVATSAAPSVNPSPASTGGSSPSTGSSPGPTQGTASASLTIQSGLPGQPGAASPLAGRVFLVLKDSIDNILVRAGWTQTGSPNDVIASWLNACATQSPACQQSNQQLGQYVVAKGALDANGATTFSGARTGTFYIFGQGAYNGQRLVWHIRVDMKPGSNVVNIDPSNALKFGR